MEKKRRIKLQGFLIFLAITATIFFSKFLFPCWRKESHDELLDALGTVIILLGLLFRVSARGYKAEISLEGKSLATAGPYALVRNPMYFGTLLIGLGVTFVLFEWWVFLLFFVGFLMIYIPQVNKETKDLSRLFGKEYEDYCRKTPKYFPNAAKLFKGDLRQYLFFKRSWVKNEIHSFIIITLAIITAEMWQDVKLFGRAEFFEEFLEFCVIAGSFLIGFIIFYEREDISNKQQGYSKPQNFRKIF